MLPTWKSYTDAYYAKYGTEPIRNARTNTQMANFVRFVGEAEAPFIAAWYLTHGKRYYTEQMHPVGMLAKDAESLRGQWATRTQITETQARQTDKRAGNSAAFDRVRAELGAVHG